MLAILASSLIIFHRQSQHLYPTSVAAAKQATPAPRQNAPAYRRPRVGLWTPPSRSSASCASLENLSVGATILGGDRASMVVLCLIAALDGLDVSWACSFTMSVQKNNRNKSLAYACIAYIRLPLCHTRIPQNQCAQPPSCMPLPRIHTSNLCVYGVAAAHVQK